MGKYFDAIKAEAKAAAKRKAWSVATLGFWEGPDLEGWITVGDPGCRTCSGRGEYGGLPAYPGQPGSGARPLTCDCARSMTRREWYAEQEAQRQPTELVPLDGMYDDESWQSSQIRPHCEWAALEIAKLFPDVADRPELVNQACDLYGVVRWVREHRPSSSWQMLFYELRALLRRPAPRVSLGRYFSEIPAGVDKEFAKSVLIDSEQRAQEWEEASILASDFAEAYLKATDPTWRRAPVQFIP